MFIDHATDEQASDQLSSRPRSCVDPASIGHVSTHSPLAPPEWEKDRQTCAFHRIFSSPSQTHRRRRWKTNQNQSPVVYLQSQWSVNKSALAMRFSIFGWRNNVTLRRVWVEGCRLKWVIHLSYNFIIYFTLGCRQTFHPRWSEEFFNNITTSWEKNRLWKFVL